MGILRQVKQHVPGAGSGPLVWWDHSRLWAVWKSAEVAILPSIRAPKCGAQPSLQGSDTRRGM